MLTLHPSWTHFQSSCPGLGQGREARRDGECSLYWSCLTSHVGAALLCGHHSGVSEAAQLQGLRYSGRPSGLLSKYRWAQAILGYCITQASRLGTCPNSCIQQSSSPPQYSLWLSFPRTQVYGHQNETAYKAVCSRAWADLGPSKEDFANRELKVIPHPPQWFLWVPVYPGKARGLRARLQGRPRYVSCFQFCRHRDVMCQAHRYYRCSYQLLYKHNFYKVYTIDENKEQLQIESQKYKAFWPESQSN